MAVIMKRTMTMVSISLGCIACTQCTAQIIIIKIIIIIIIINTFV